MSGSPGRQQLIRWGALAIGAMLFGVSLYYVDFRIAAGTIRTLGLALPLAVLFSGLWHLARTWAWAWCFPQPRTVCFARLARVRLAAEAFSYLTLRGIAGEPLKVVLLGDCVDPREATAAVALERIAYIVGTTIIVGVGSVIALASFPLTHLWTRVFTAFAIGAGVIAALTGLVVAGRGTYFQARLGSDGPLGAETRAGRIARFAAAVERQILELVRSHPSRLAVLMTATVAAYMCMALEAWVILRATSTPTSLAGALAIETFSRVASFGSAFIPANLGALEASSLAAVGAVGAAGGGAALALARRLRGLFWAGLGLAIYPRTGRSLTTATPAGSSPARSTRTSTLLYSPYEEGVTISPVALLAGLPIAERVVRSALKAGYARILVLLPGRAHDRLATRLRALSPAVAILASDAAWADVVRGLPAEGLTVIGAGTVVSPALLRDARELIAVDEIVDVPAGPGWPVSGVLRATAAGAGDLAALREALQARRHIDTPWPSGIEVADGKARLALRMRGPADLPLAEETIRRSSYKETDATLARFNRRISVPISIALIRTPLTANQLSLMLVALGLYAAWLFSIGHYWTGVLGGFLSLAASVLDGCDGEIARLKYQESALGCWIETAGDYSYYIAIFAGLTVGAVRQTGSETFYWIGAIALTGTLLTFALLIFLRSRITAGQPEKLHAVAAVRFRAAPSWWTALIWRISFVATRSAMPYGIMAFALFGALPGIVVLAAIGANVYWVSLLLKLRHLLGSDAPLPA